MYQALQAFLIPMHHVKPTENDVCCHSTEITQSVQRCNKTKKSSVQWEVMNRVVQHYCQRFSLFLLVLVFSWWKVLRSSCFPSAGSVLFAARMQPTLMHLFANGGNYQLGDKCYFQIPTKWHRKALSKCHLCSANIVCLLLFALNNRFFSSMEDEEPNHGYLPSVTVGFAVSLEDCIQAPPLTFWLLFWAPSVFQSNQHFICQFCISYSLFGMPLPKHILVLFKT